MQTNHYWYINNYSFVHACINEVIFTWIVAQNIMRLHLLSILYSLMEYAKEMIKESLPIKCLEAVILGSYPFLKQHLTVFPSEAYKSPLCSSFLNISRSQLFFRLWSNEASVIKLGSLHNCVQCLRTVALSGNLTELYPFL